MPKAIVDSLTQVAFAGSVFDQDDLTGADDTRFVIASRELYAIVEVDDILPAWGRVPVQIVGRRHLAEDDARRRQACREPPTRRRLNVDDLCILEVRFALIIRTGGGSS